MGCWGVRGWGVSWWNREFSRKSRGARAKDTICCVVTCHTAAHDRWYHSTKWESSLSLHLSLLLTFGLIMWRHRVKMLREKRSSSTSSSLKVWRHRWVGLPLQVPVWSPQPSRLQLYRLTSTLSVRAVTLIPDSIDQAYPLCYLFLIKSDVNLSVSSQLWDN